MSRSPESRPLDPAERYFYLLDRLWPMNIVAVAELDRHFDAAQIHDAWKAISSRRALALTRMTSDGERDVALEHAPEIEPDFAVAEAPWGAAAEREQREAFDPRLGPLVRCRFMPVSAEASALALVIHHPLGDARTALWLLQELLRELEGPRKSSDAGGLPPPMHERLPSERRWLSNRRAMIELLREIRDEQGPAGHVPECPWHDRFAPGREPVIETVRFSAGETARIVAAAREVRATVQGVLSASWLLAAGELSEDGEGGRNLTLSVPADLRSSLTPPVDPRELGMYITILASVHTGSDRSMAGLAPQVSRDVRRRLARGEGELFYALTRPESVPISDDGLARFARTIETVPQSLAVSNVGVIDAAGDPEWVRSLSFLLAPTPNQVAFVAATTYRDRLTLNITTDRCKLDPKLARRLIAAGEQRLREPAARIWSSG